MNYIFELDKVSFKNIIKYPELKIEGIKTTFITGKSGCGKSTLLKLLNCTLSPSSGEIYYNTTNIKTINTIKLRREVLLVSQSIYLFDESIEKNFENYYNFIDLDKPSNEMMTKFLRLCCLDYSLNTNCSLMSGGERQRVFLAISLSFMPKVLMLDEPTSALDSTTSYEVFKNIKTFCIENNISLICISHDNLLTNKFADNVINLEKEI